MPREKECDVKIEEVNKMVYKRKTETTKRCCNKIEWKKREKLEDEKEKLERLKRRYRQIGVPKKKKKLAMIPQN